MNQEHIEQIFERADIQQIRAFLLDNTVIAGNSHGTYQERLNMDSEDIIDTLKNLSKNSGDEKQPEEAMRDLRVALASYRDVFTEIGMKAGARLLYQLLHEGE